ncbi:MAG: sulfatase-like hydrolase/transferase, partial [Phycisphaeraceae bacterium]|nr:sulfatase-like hydrolase/transferase [Phycisphaeraceae bacterium]
WALALHFINPHDICFHALAEYQETRGKTPFDPPLSTEVATLLRALKRPVGVDEATFFADHCPPMPDNAAPQADEPEGIATLLDQRPFRRRAREEWAEADWRLHRWAYCRLTEMVDAQIGVVLDALDDNGLTDDTVVIFTSDHGDHDGAHGLEHKTVPYEEAARIPLIIAAPGETDPGTVDGKSLCCNSVDLLPTLCDYAGAEVPDGLPGQSLRCVAAGKEDAADRVVKIEFEFGDAWVDQRFKYVRYDHGANAEQLYDLVKDPGETRNFLHDEEMEEVRERFRDLAEN